MVASNDDEAFDVALFDLLEGRHQERVRAIVRGAPA